MRFQYFFLTLFSLIKLIDSRNKCIFNDNNDKAYKDNIFRIITNFDDLNSLNFNCSNQINMSMLGFKPNKQLILDNSLNLKGLKITNPVNDMFVIIFENFKGFDLTSNPFKYVNFTGKFYKFWSIGFSNFDFYYKNNPVNQICNKNLFDVLPKENPFTGFILSLEFDNKFSSNTCPFIFSNIKLNFINFKHLSDSLVEKYIFGFQNVSEDLLQKINSSIFQLNIKFYHTDLNSNLLNNYVFVNLTVLDLNGQIKQIQQDLFKYFINIQFIRFRMQNINHILVKNNKWIDSLNFDLNIDINNSTQVKENGNRFIILVLYQTFYNVTLYDYPEKDFCYFKHFPHNRLVLAKLRPNYKTSCTCTEIYIIQYSYLFSREINSYLGSISGQYYLSQYFTEVLNDNKFTHCVNASFRETIKNCNFNKRLNLCNIKTTVKSDEEEIFFYINDWEILSKYSDLILSLYLNPIFSIISILFSVLIIIILSGREIIPKEMIRMYAYLRINSVLNIIFVFIRLFKLIDTCSSQDIICLAIHSKSESIQYFKIIFIRIIGNIFQSASNLTHITFTLSRFITVSSHKSSCLTLIHKISFIKYLFVVLLFSFIINIHIFFEFSIFKETSQTFQLKSFDSDKFSIYKQEPFNDYKENFIHSEYLVLDILQYIKIIFSDIFYILISFIIDLYLFFFVKKSMIKKERLTVSFVTNVNRVVLDISRDQNNNEQEKQKKINSLKNRLTLMIILNGFNFLIFRLPMAMLSFYGFIFRYDYQEKVHKPDLTMYIICRYFKFCRSLNAFFYFIYLNSFIIQFFIFYKLDKNFKKGFKGIKIYLKKYFRKNS
jgi:hypothetical protein